MVHKRKTKLCIVLSRYSKTSNSIITKEEKQAISELKSYDDLVIIDTDKGNFTVVMDKTEYNNKLMVLLNDRNTYKIVSKNPIPLIE